MSSAVATSVVDRVDVPIRLRSAPRVSLVIPTYNRAGSLRRLLRALAGITQPPGGMEIVVINDGSTDATSTVAADAGVICFTQPRNAGRTRARDRGWRCARGEIVVFLDDDVVPEVHAIDHMVRALDTAHGVGARILPMNTSQVIAHYMHVDRIVNHYTVGDQVLWLVTAAAAFRREALERIDGFDFAYHQAGEDVDMTLRMVEAGGVLRVEPRAIVWHDHGSRFRDLWGTCNRYGRAYNTLASRHQTHRAERMRAAKGRANPMEWMRLYRGYRAGTSMPRSLAFLALHAAVGVPYAIGLMQSGANGNSRTRPDDVDLIGVRAPAVRH